jgi:L-aspartate oxidase
VHGANRLASNSLLEGLVFGRRVAAGLVLELPAPARGDQAPGAGLTRDARPARIRAVLSEHGGIRRDGPGLQQALSELDGLGDGPLATVARAVIAAAGARRESRGCHWRADHPAPSDLWKRQIVVRLDAGGRPVATADERRSAA